MTINLIVATTNIIGSKLNHENRFGYERFLRIREVNISTKPNIGETMLD